MRTNLRRKITGLALIFTGLLANQWVIGALISPDGVIEWVPFRIAILTGELVLVGIGIAVLSLHQTELMKNLLVLSLSMVGVLAFLEITLRIVPTNVPDFKMVRVRYEFLRSTQYHPTWGWSFLPNVEAIWDWTGRERTPIITEFNTLPIPGYPDYGMRDDGLDPEIDSVIPVFGDSFTFGATVEREEIWSELIEARNPRTDLLNLANGGGLTKALEQYRVLEDLLPPHDIVIYQLWLGNEFYDNYGFPLGLGQWEELQRSHLSETRKFWIQTIFRLSVLVFKATNRIQELNNPEAATLGYVRETDQLWDERFGNFSLYPANPILLRNTEPDYDERLTKGVENTFAALQDLKALAGSRDLIIFIFPFKSQLYEEIVLSHRPELDLAKPNRIILDFCAQLEIICFDLTSNLLDYKDEKLFWDFDSHFTPVGQFFASVEAESILKQYNILIAD